MEKFQKKSFQIRNKIEELCEKRNENILEIVEIEKEIEVYLSLEQTLKDEIIDHKLELMTLDSEYEDENGIKELQKEIEIVKEEKNFLIKERKLVSKGIANHLRNI
jgi:hypothetical protein